MSENSLIPRLLWSITDLTRYLRELMESDELLQDVWVIGEVSNLVRPSSGHIYFTLKDSNASLRCVMWRTTAVRLNVLPNDGQAVEVHGRLSIYETSGQYQLYVDSLRPAGEGVLYQEFLRLKDRLEAEGLFDPERKRAVPKYPKRIGIITSPTGAALRDMLNTIKRRFPCAEVVIAPTPVQGIEAPPGIVAALNHLARLVVPDVILLARGGGSMEDLWAFNDETVARAIVQSPTPVITGVGHETDFTIADFVSDLRAPTPTAAAELATPNRSDLLSQIRDYEFSLDRSLGSVISRQIEKLNEQEKRLSLRSPHIRVQTQRQQLDELLYRAEIALSSSLQLRRFRNHALEQKLGALNPLEVLRRGYAIVRFRTGELIRMVHQVSDQDELSIRMQDGEFEAVAHIKKGFDRGN